MTRKSSRGNRPAGLRKNPWLLLVLATSLPGADSLLFPAAGAAETGHEHHAPAAYAVPAPGYGELIHPGPEPATYSLPTVRKAPDGEVLLSSGKATRLHQVMAGRLVVLGFIFTNCSDPAGCPLASFVMRQLGRRAAADPMLNDKVRLVSLSFDPARDTPARMRAYGESVRAGNLDWQFLTTSGESTLAPILKAYGQSVIKDPSGGSYSHQLRVFLIDSDGNIRNEYSTSFLHADTVLADLKTLVRPASAPVAVRSPGTLASVAAGDDKTGYETSAYRTRSRALTGRAGKGLNLRELIKTPPLGLPPAGLQPKDLPSDAQIALGRRLFQDRRLSHNNTLSCASCHLPDQGFTNQELRTPVGIEGRTVKRNAPSLYNVAYLQRLFHDAREYSLEHQIWAPLLASNEMGNPSIGYVLEKLASTEDYPQQFARAFPGRGLDMETLGLALAAYQRGLVSGNSAFDRWRYGDEEAAVSAAARRGFELFSGRAGCSGCHRVGVDYALFTDQLLHNTGVGYVRSMNRKRPEEALVGPGESLRLAPGVVDASSEAPPNDLGRYEVTLQPGDRWKFRTPGLRNIALTAPYMHDGSMGTLSEVLEFYARGGFSNEGLDPALQPFPMSARDKADLLAFLESLTGNNVTELTLDAFSQLIGH